MRIIRTAISVFDLSIASNVVPLIFTSSTSVLARAEAVRGTSSRTLISPKKSPFSSVARTRVSPPMALSNSTVPDWTMNISVPMSPSEKMISPMAWLTRNFS